MNAVRKYIESMFIGLPDEPEVQALKENVIQKSMERYEKLLLEGLPPQDALAQLIIELEAEEKEILASYHKEQEQNNLAEESMTLNEAHEFIALNKKESRRIGLAILYILISVGLIPTFGVFNLAELAVLIMFIVIALSVSMMIMAGMRLGDQFENDLYTETVLSDEDYLVLQQEFRTFKSKESYRIALGVALCILSVVPLLTFSFIGNENLVEGIGVLILLTLVGLGVYQFIQYGMTYGVYERLLNLGEYSEENLAYERKLEPVSGIYWMIVILIYLGWSFITMDWHITWIIWPLAGILWSITALVAKAVAGE